MAGYSFTINFTQNPIQGEILLFNVSTLNPANTIYKSFFATFVNNVPINQLQLLIGNTTAQTIQNLSNHINAYYSDYFTVSETTANSITITVLPDLDNFVLFNPVNTPYFTFTSNGYVAPVIEDLLTDFELQDFSIRVIDTYTNNRELAVERAQFSSCVLTYRGDGINTTLYTSTLKFTFLNVTKADAAYKHLLTGDENRYKVVVVALDAEENEQVYWQGFLLPDLYKEPYHNDVIFLEFEAVDRLASLKGKFFKPWYYENKFNLYRLFRLILDQTKIDQDIVIKPSIEPFSTVYTWLDINIDLSIYKQDKGYADLYTILTDLLTSQGLSLFSFKNLWFLEGFSRRNEEQGLAYKIDGDLNISTVQVFKELKEFYGERKSTMVELSSPLREVSVDFTFKGNKNLFPENIVQQEAFFARYANESFVTSSPVTELLPDYWFQSAGQNDFLLLDNARTFLKMRTRDPFLGGITQPYAVTEAESLTRFVESKYKPYVYPGVTYEFEIEVRVLLKVNFFPWQTTTLQELFDQRWQNDAAEKLVVVQVLKDGLEFATNRPNGVGMDNFFFNEKQAQAEILIDVAGGNGVQDPYIECIFKLKKKFRVGSDGILTFRWLAPINNAYLTQGYFNMIVLEPKVLKINVDNKELNGVLAVRPINYTTKQDWESAYIASADMSITSSLGLGRQLLPYFEEIPHINPEPEPLIGFFNLSQFFSDLTSGALRMRRFEITPEVEKLLFKDHQQKSVFIVRPDGDEEHFFSFYTLRNGGKIYCYWLKEIFDNNGLVVLFYPDDYRADEYLLEPFESIQVMRSIFPEEDLANRANWRLYGDDEKHSYLEVLALLLLGMQQQLYYKLNYTSLDFVWPNDLIQFTYDNADRVFMPTSLTIDLFNNKTTVTADEAVFVKPNDAIFL